MKTQKEWFDLGVNFGDSGMHKEAIEAYRQATQIQPDNAAIYNTLGTAYGKSGLHQEEIEAYQQAIGIVLDLKGKLEKGWGDMVSGGPSVTTRKSSLL